MPPPPRQRPAFQFDPSYIILPGIVLAALWWFWPEGSKSQPPGVLVASAPFQNEQRDKPFKQGKYLIRPMAKFDMLGRVLAKKVYSSNTDGADAVPVDLVLGWQRMSDSAVVDQISFSISNRYASWRASQLPIPESEINSSASNMHMVPSTPEIGEQIRHVKVGQVVHITGDLINIDGPNMFSMATSLSRNDIGRGACEVVYIRSLTVK